MVQMNPQTYRRFPPGRPPFIPRTNLFSPGIPQRKPEKSKAEKIVTVSAVIISVLLVALIIFLITKSGENGEDIVPECAEDFECSGGEVCDNGVCVSSTLVECDEGDFRECGSDIGECSLGTESCVNGQWNDVCENEILPATEICDQKDNDCDVFVDEENVCDNGNGGGGGILGAECLNDIDCLNNETCANGFCVGDVGDLSCLIGQFKSCGSDIGECRKGNQVCVNWIWSSCSGAINPSTEICDGKDNDCDGSADEGGVCQVVRCGDGICGNTESQSLQSEGVSLCLADCLKQTTSCNELYNLTSDIEGRKKNSVWGVYKNGVPFNLSNFCIGENNKIGLYNYSVRRYVCSNNGGMLNMYLGLCQNGEKCLDGACRKDICGDGYCNAAKGETISTCLQDCSVCGDGKCISAVGETSSSCSRDCLVQLPANINFSVGNTIKVKAYTTNLAVRSSASETATLLGSKNSGAVGNITGGPIYEGVYWWYKIKWSAGLEGWSVANFLEKIEIFAIGNNIRVRSDVSNLAVKFEPSYYATSLGDKKGYNIDSSAFGKIIDGPRYGDGFEFWKIIWIDGLEGWSAGLRSDSSGVRYFLEKVSSIPSCENGKIVSCGLSSVGECKMGSRTCVSGQWGSCIGAVYPTAEICDGKDNDCDGTADRKLCNQPGLNSPCYGYSSCVSGAWSSCDMVIEPTKEECDNYKYDNDCDGFFDEYDPDAGLSCSVENIDSRTICIDPIRKGIRWVVNPQLVYLNKKNLNLLASYYTSLSLTTNYCTNANGVTTCKLIDCSEGAFCWHGECMAKADEIFRLEVGAEYSYNVPVSQPFYQWIRVFDTIDSTLTLDINWGDGNNERRVVKEGVWIPISHNFSFVRTYNGQITATNSRSESKTTSVSWITVTGSVSPADSKFKKGDRIVCVGDNSGDCWLTVPTKVGVVSKGTLGTVDHVSSDYWTFVKFDNGLAGWIYPDYFAHNMLINISGPESVSRNTTNKWFISAVDPWGGSLSYDVKWGETYTQGAWTGGHYADTYTGASGQSVEMTHNYLVDSRGVDTIYFPKATITITNSKGEKITRYLNIQVHPGKFSFGNRVISGQINPHLGPRDLRQYLEVSVNCLPIDFQEFLALSESEKQACRNKGFNQNQGYSRFQPANINGTILQDNDPIYTQPYGIWWKVDFDSGVDGWVAHDGIRKN